MIAWNGHLLNPAGVSWVHPIDSDGRTLIDLSGGQTIGVFCSVERHAELVSLLTGQWPPGTPRPVPPAPSRSPSHPIGAGPL